MSLSLLSPGLVATADYPYPTNFEAPLPAWPVQEACNTLVQAASDSKNSSLALLQVFPLLFSKKKKEKNKTLLSFFFLLAAGGRPRAPDVVPCIAVVVLQRVPDAVVVPRHRAGLLALPEVLLLPFLDSLLCVVFLSFPVVSFSQAHPPAGALRSSCLWAVMACRTCSSTMSLSFSHFSHACLCVLNVRNSKELVSSSALGSHRL